MPLARLLLLVLCTGLATAAAGETPPLRDATWRALESAYEAIEAGRLDDARARLTKLGPRVARYPYERAVVARMLGHVYVRLDRLPDAADAFTTALDADVLPTSDRAELARNLARIQIQLEAYDAALAALDRAPRAEDDAEVRMLRGVALYRLERWAAAADELEAALRLAADPPIEWRELLLAARLQQGALEQAVPVLEALLEARPADADYWRQLAAVHQQLERYDAAAAALASARRLSLLDAQETADLVQLYLFTGQPLRAAAVLEQEFESGRLPPTVERRLLLADAWELAREPDRAIGCLQSAGDDAPPAILARLGRLQYRVRDWQAAWSTLSSAARAGQGEPGHAETVLLAGIAALKAGETDAAAALLGQAREFEATRVRAQRWLDSQPDAH